jgi:hypothetical protein
VEQDLAHRAEIAERKAIDHRKHKFSAAPSGASAAKRARSNTAHSSSGHGSGSSSRQGGRRQRSSAEDSKTEKTDRIGGKGGKAPLLSFEDEDE